MTVAGDHQVTFNMALQIGRSEGGYTVRHFSDHIKVFGSLPVSDFAALAKAWAERGYTDVANGSAIGEHDVAYVVANRETFERLKALATIEADQVAAGDREYAWFLGPDTGTSSLTIFSVLSLRHAKVACVRLEGGRGPSVPLDAGDFGRCHRLLEAAGWSAQQLGKVADYYPAWRPLVDAWDELTALYLEELPTDTFPRLCARITELRKADR